MQTAIIAIGTASPSYKRRQEETAELVSACLNLKPSVKRLLKSVYKSTGIDFRYSVLKDYCKSVGEFEFFPNDAETAFPATAARMQIYKENALALGLSAIQNCLASNSDFDIKSITHLITVSCTGMYAPGLDIEIVQQLNLSSTVKRTAVNFMGCYGSFNAIRLADAICKADADATVLIISVELCTIHFQKNTDLDNIISNAIFSDGAGALLISSKSQNTKSFSIEAFHNDLIPSTNKEMAWAIGNQGFDIVLSSYVPEIIKSGIAEFTQRLLDIQNISLSAIDYFAIHPGGLKILQACEYALNITTDDNRYSYDVLRHFGNMSSATIIFVFKKIWDDLNNDNHNKNIFSCAFGPGLTLESMILKTHIIA
ncbi:MAG: type III polyketide synthase [Gammaproteobacteria bacterium]|nr:type III polyketide synthase [Gammaproteobacteria bacterium]